MKTLDEKLTIYLKRAEEFFPGINSISLFYDSLVTKSLNFKYEETIRAVQRFMNYYKPDYVVECGCGKDF